MSKSLEERLEQTPVVGWLVLVLKRFQLKAFEGFSLFDVIAMYARGIVRGALSARASAIAFSLFMAIFPLLIFLITLIPFVIPYVSVGNENFDTQFLNFLETFLPTATGDYFSEIYQQIKDQKQGGLLRRPF